MFARVTLPVPHNDFFTYGIPVEIESLVRPGTFVIVPFRDKAATGVVWELVETADFGGRNIRNITSLGDRDLDISSELLQLINYVSRRYLTTPGMVLKAALPPGTLLSRQLYIYPGRVELPAIHEDPITEFLQKIRERPGQRTLSDGRQDIGRNQFESLLQSGLITLSPFKGQKPASLRGKEKWLKAVISDIPRNLNEGQLTLYKILTQNEKGVKASSLKKLGFSSATATSLIKRGMAEYLYLPREIENFGGMTSLANEEAAVLTLWQESALQRVMAGIDSHLYKGILLYGITSSGKTQVYLEAAQYALSRGKSVLVLVPEISLTPQIISRFERFLKSHPLVWHSHLSSSERSAVYRHAKLASAALLIGTRSSIFAPLNNLGLIVVDEEQDHSYKQDDPAPRYNARDLALERGRLSKAVVLLGSATPSAEAYYLSRTADLEFLTLPQRVAGIGRPHIEIISTAFKTEPKPGESPVFPRGFRPISERLYEELSVRLKNNEQAIILLNRRGYSSAVVCFECGWVGKCPDCEIGWTYHKIKDRMICHYCGKEQKGPLTCSQCNSTRLSFRSTGTERLEETLRAILPNAKTVRLDTDVATRKWESRDILNNFGKGKYQILIGTQMVAKGHHFPRVSLVGVVGADIGLSLPDFRASERVLQLLTQAAGRSGRSAKKGDPGLVIIQTFSPASPIYEYLRSNNFLGFLDDELLIRKQLGYPPYKRLVLLIFSSAFSHRARDGAERFRDEIAAMAADNKVDILGPVESPIFKRGKVYRYQIMFKIPLSFEPAELLQGTNDFMKRSRGLSIRIDIDPVSFM